jgi:hypothetical protein
VSAWLLDREPFELVIVDGGGQATKSGPDPVRDLRLAHPELVSVELPTTPASAPIVAVRR